MHIKRRIAKLVLALALVGGAFGLGATAPDTTPTQDGEQAFLTASFTGPGQGGGAIPHGGTWS